MNFAPSPIRLSLAATALLFVASPIAAGTSFTDCRECGTMVVIPAGSGVFGSTRDEQAQQGVPPGFASHEGPQISITIARPFAMMQTEVTRGQYAAFVAETHRPDPARCGVHDARTDSWGAQAGYNWHHSGFDQQDTHPVVCVSWTDATAYAAWLSKKSGKSYRLPTEEEWEYAARAGTSTARYWGDNAADVCLNANIATADTVASFNSVTWEDKLVCTTKHSYTVPVGSYDPNPFGLQDMIGNVWEWTADCYHADYKGAPLDGSLWTKEGNCTRRIARGGAFHSQIWLARAAIRGEDLDQDNHDFSIGFRLARDLDQPAAQGR